MAIQQMKRILICMNLLIFLKLSVSAQFLDVPLIGQRNSNWCWAAGIEMIATFHNKTLTGQCDLVKDLIVFQHHKNNNQPHDGIFPNLCCIDYCSGTGTPTCNYTIDHSKRGGKIGYQYMDMIFSKNGFFSIEDTRTDLLDWNAIKREIEACRPFLVFLHKADNASDPDDHVVTVKGYYEMLNSQYILANDPIENPIPGPNCVGCEILLPITIFTDPPKRLNGALEVVRSIYPRDEVTCDNCEKKPVVSETPLIKAIEDNPGTMSSIGSGVIGNLNQLLTSTDALGDNLFFKNDFSYWYIDWTLMSYVTVDYTGLVADKAVPRLAFFLEQDGSNWIIKSTIMANCTALTNSQEFVEADRPTETISIGGKNLSIIEIMPGNYQFYRVTRNRSIYLSPVKFYPDLDYKVQYLYPEEEVKKEMMELLGKRRVNTGGGDRDSSGSNTEETGDDKKETKKKRGWFWWLFGKKK